MPVIVPTKQCDLRCTHCMRTEYKGDALDVDLLKRFLTDVNKLTKQRQHSLTGGEPTVHPRFDALLGTFRVTGNTMYIVSNGQGIEGQKAVIRNKDVVDWVSISLDAPTAEMNDHTRGKGAFDKVMLAVERYHAAGVLVDFRFVLHDGNAGLVDKAFELGKDLGLKRLRFSTLHPVGKASEHEMSVTFEKLDAARLRIKELKKQYPGIGAGLNTRHMLPYMESDWPKDMCTPIGGGMNGIVLLPDGKVSFCCDLYDLDFIYERYEGDNEQLNPIVGDYSIESLDTIIKRKRERITLLKQRRAEDVEKGRLTGNRQYICENCKYYHYFAG